MGRPSLIPLAAACALLVVVDCPGVLAARSWTTVRQGRCGPHQSVLNELVAEFNGTTPVGPLEVHLPTCVCLRCPPAPLVSGGWCPRPRASVDFTRSMGPTLPRGVWARIKVAWGVCSLPSSIVVWSHVGGSATMADPCQHLPPPPSSPDVHDQLHASSPVPYYACVCVC